MPSIWNPTGLDAGLTRRSAMPCQPVLSTSLVEPSGIVTPAPTPNDVEGCADALPAAAAATKPKTARLFNRPFMSPPDGLLVGSTTVGYARQGALRPQFSKPLASEQPVRW